MKDEETGCHTYWHSALTFPVWLIPCPIPNRPYGFCGCKALSEILFGTMKEEDWIPHLWGHLLTQCTVSVWLAFPTPFLTNHMFFCGCKAPSDYLWHHERRRLDTTPLGPPADTAHSPFLSGTFPAPFLMDYMVSVDTKYHQRLSLAPWKKRLDATPLGPHTDSVLTVHVWVRLQQMATAVYSMANEMGPCSCSLCVFKKRMWPVRWVHIHALSTLYAFFF